MLSVYRSSRSRIFVLSFVVLVALALFGIQELRKESFEEGFEGKARSS